MMRREESGTGALALCQPPGRLRFTTVSPLQSCMGLTPIRLRRKTSSHLFGWTRRWLWMDLDLPERSMTKAG